MVEISKMTSVLLGCLLAVASATYDSDKYFKDHSKRWKFRLIASIFLSFLNCHNLIDYILNLLLISTTFYLIFDYALNLFKKNDFFYIGETAKLDIWKREHFKYLKTFDLLTKLLFFGGSLALKLCINF